LKLGLLGAVAVMLSALTCLCGCSSVRPNQQRLVAKPNMTFSDSAVFTYNSGRLMPQLAPGLASSGGAQNSGCTSCR
jgi:hypothetical protein